MNDHLQSAGYAIALSLASLLAACSAGNESSSPREGEDGFDQTMGALVAHLKRVPDDVRCIELRVSNGLTPYVQLDVTPGDEATLRIGPLRPGYTYFYGEAYSVGCSELWNVDGGQYAAQTWYADYQSVEIWPGRPTPVSIVFRHMGSADISIDFDDSFCPDGGFTDAGCPVPAATDHGFAR